ncbi:hypothetical protein AAG906_018599 [Vitis piasezkii]
MLAAHEIIKILGSLTPVQLTTLVILCSNSLLCSPYSSLDQVTIGDGNSLPILNTVPISFLLFLCQGSVTKKILLKGGLGTSEFSSSSSPRAFVTTGSFSDGAIWHSVLDTQQFLFFLRL